MNLAPGGAAAETLNLALRAHAARQAAPSQSQTLNANKQSSTSFQSLVAQGAAHRQKQLHRVAELHDALAPLQAAKENQVRYLYKSPSVLGDTGPV